MMKASARNNGRTSKFMAALRIASVAGLLGLGAFGAGQASSAGATQYTCDGRTATIVITSYGNYLGTSGDDVIVMDIPISQAGAHLDALGGDDVICGSSQADTISGGSGKDTIFGNGGDRLHRW
jgi:Ca2+-binding RTX toxin-like protein